MDREHQGGRNQRLGGVGTFKHQGHELVAPSRVLALRQRIEPLTSNGELDDPGGRSMVAARATALPEPIRKAA